MRAPALPHRHGPSGWFPDLGIPDCPTTPLPVRVPFRGFLQAFAFAPALRFARRPDGSDRLDTGLLPAHHGVLRPSPTSKSPPNPWDLLRRPTGKCAGGASTRKINRSTRCTEPGERDRNVSRETFRCRCGVRIHAGAERFLRWAIRAARATGVTPGKRAAEARLAGRPACRASAASADSPATEP